MQAFRSVRRVIDLKSVVLSGLAVLSTWLCIRYGITADFPLTLIATAIVFPLVFSISTAYERREKVLEAYGSIKAYGRALYFAARDWPAQPSEERTEAAKTVLLDLLHACRDMFTSPVKEAARHQPRINASFSSLSKLIERLRDDGVAAAECSRGSQYVVGIIGSYETIKNIYQYRTPRTLRAFSIFFIIVLPVLYGPYFAHQAGEYGPGLGFVMPVLFTIILVGLSNIQDHLENPFDQIGDDDVAINPEKFIETLEVMEG
jgi:predicted membrane chloride channel (bestrophin family)